jgi:hypothetical protein
MGHGEFPVLVVNKSELLGCLASPNGGSSRLKRRCANQSLKSSQRELREEAKQD